MSQFTIGDLAQSTMMRLQSTRMKTELTKLTEELSTGIVADIGTHLGGDVGFYADVENNLRLLDAFDLAANEASHFADVTQSTLDRIAARLGSSVESTLPATTTAYQEVRDHAAKDARNDLETIVAALNSTTAGRSLFAGAATDTTPLVGPTDFLDTLKAALPPITDPASLVTAINDWFDDPAGYDTIAYQGSTNDIAPVMIAKDSSVQMAVRADAEQFKEVLKGLSLSALATDSDWGFDIDEQIEVFDAAASVMLNAQSSLTSLQADIGAAQERIESAKTRNAAARIGFEQARTTLVGADAFETATRLDDVQVRLESLYAVTARMSRLSLLNYI
ncbi:MAG: flagellar hook protein [Rhodobacteraceae bacterium]|nr:flagellar hook protein [Paracoccaceae bacterium]